MPAEELSDVNVVDYLHVKGVRLIEPGTPQWKYKPIREKNLQLIAEYLAQEAERQKEEAKWEAIPEWKKPLLREREKKRKELEEAQLKLEEAERKERERFEQLPEWKQKVLIKRKSTLSEPDTNSDTKSENSGHNGDAKTDENDNTPLNGCQENGVTEEDDSMEEASHLIEEQDLEIDVDD